MKNRKIWIATILALAAALFCVGCGNDLTREDVEKQYGNYIEVSYDIGEGIWDNNPTRQVTHRYKPADGGVKLYVPGSNTLDKANATRNGHFIEGWYRDENFTQKWNFETDRTSESLKLYARWLPNFRYTFYVQGDAAHATPLNSVTVREGGKLSASATPVREGHTYLGTLYSDAACTVAWDYDTPHAGTLIDGVQSNVEVPVYSKWLEGEYSLVRGATDLNMASSANLYVLADAIDCYEQLGEYDNYLWTGVRGEFNNVFEGNGVVIQNIVFDPIGRGAGNKVYGGLFDRIGENAVIKNVTFRDVVMKIDDTSSFRRTLGLFAGSIAKGAKFENVTVSGKIVFTNVSENETSVYKLLAEYAEFIDGDAHELGIDELTGITWDITVECVDEFGYTVLAGDDRNTLTLTKKA